MPMFSPEFSGVLNLLWKTAVSIIVLRLWLKGK